MSESTMRDVLVRLEEQEAELRALRRRLDGPPGARRSRAQPPRRATGRRRLALATLLIALLMLTPLSLAAANFTDLNPGSVHNTDINTIADAGITLGCEANARYCPNDFVTREQMASFLARTAGLGGNAPVVNAATAVTAQTAGTIANQANSATIAATSANTANTIVLRDGNGNFTAGTITGNLTGTATNATNAVNANTAIAANNADQVDGKDADELIGIFGAAGGTVPLTDQYQNLITVAINAPSAGYAQVTGTIFSSGATGCPCIVDFRLVNTTSGEAQIEFYTLDLEGFSEDSGASSFVFAVPAGSSTFAVQAKVEVSDTSPFVVEADADIAAIYTTIGTTDGGGTGPASQPNKRRPQR